MPRRQSEENRVLRPDVDTEPAKLASHGPYTSSAGPDGETSFSILSVG